MRGSLLQQKFELTLLEGQRSITLQLCRKLCEWRAYSA